MGIATLPFCEFRISVVRPFLSDADKQRLGYVDRPQTLGQHLRKRRLDLRLRQEDAASRLGVKLHTYDRWEHGEDPRPSRWPAIFQFLEYSPLPDPATSGERLRQIRLRLGMNQIPFARKLRIALHTFWLYERDEANWSAEFEAKLLAVESTLPI
jgi:transcriptional regulator with XRE-family HTH domain